MTDKPNPDNHGSNKHSSANHSPGKDNDPKEVGREAEELQPNQDMQDDRENIAEDEMGVPGEEKIDASEKQSRPLTRPEDNAKVDRVTPAEEAEEVPAPNARDYVISPKGLRNLFIASNVAGVALIVFILTLASSAPQGRLTPADETQYQRTLQGATDTISTAAPNEGDQTARIPIDEAISLVAEKGLGPVAEALAAPGTPANAAPAEGAAAPAQPTQQTQTQPAQQSNQQPAQSQQNQNQSQQAQAQPAQSQTEQAQPASLDLSAGETVFTTNCVSCHQTTGQGVAGAFPPLAGHVPALYNADRSYPINVLLYGLQGEIQVEGQSYNGVMASWKQLSDENIADVLNYVSNTWGNKGALKNFQPYKPEEIKSARSDSLSSDEVYALRQKLGLSGKN